MLQVFKQLNLSPPEISLGDETGDIDRAKKPWEIVPIGHKIGTPVPLFKELVYLFYDHLFHSFYSLSFSFWCYFFILLTYHVK